MRICKLQSSYYRNASTDLAGNWS